MVSDQILQARREMVQQIMDKIRDNRDFTRFYEHIQVVFTHLGLHYTPIMQDFLNSRNCDNSAQLHEYLQEIKDLFIKMIK